MISTHVKNEWNYGTLRFELNTFDKQQLQLVNQRPGMKLTGRDKKIELTEKRTRHE